jgi:hypothetical protein
MLCGYEISSLNKCLDRHRQTTPFFIFALIIPETEQILIDFFM